MHATRYWYGKVALSIANIFRKKSSFNSLSTKEPEQKISVVFHAYHLDLACQIFDWLKEFAADVDLPVNLVVTTPRESFREISAMAKGTKLSTELLEVENHGRDIWPFLQVCQSGILANSALVLKIHTKAPRAIAGKVELNVYSVHELLSSSLVPGLLAQSKRNPYFVATFKKYVGRTASWGTNVSKYFQLMKKMELKVAPNKLRFPAGTIFWTTGAYTSFIGSLKIDREDFTGEPSPDDGATEHVIERLFGMLAKDNGGVIPLEKLVTGGHVENRNLRD